MRAKENESNKNKKSILIILLLLFLILALAAVCVWALFFRDGGSGDGSSLLAPDYAPMDQDSNAVDMEGDSTDKLEPSQGGGAVGLEYSDVVTVSLSEKTVKMYYGNPSRSYNNVVLQVVVQDTLLAQSELLVPGKRLPQLPLKEEALARLSEGGYKGKFVISFYNPETGEKAMVDSEVEITVNVKK